MENITIKIPAGLSNEKELILIAKQLGKSYLPGGKTKLIGAGYEIQKLQTTINIIREPVETVTITFVCPVCNTIFDKPQSKILYTNYGGGIRQRRCCSDDCRDQYISINPARIAKSKRELVSIYKR